LELLVKERLTGAIILVVLVVLLVPELLSGPKGPAATPPAAGAASPSLEEPPLRSYTINLGDESHSQSETANGAAANAGPPQPSGPAQPTTTQAATPDKDVSEASSWDSSQADSSASADPNTTSAAANPQPSRSATAPVTSPSQRSAATPKANPPQATARVDTPPANSSAQSSRPTAPKGNQATPPAEAPQKPTRTAAAEKPATKAHTAVAPAAQESGGWGVQLGVFASKENADRLAVEVRVKGFKASVSPVTSGKRKLYRVRVGPAADKSAAQDLQSKLKAAGRPGGTVVPYS
jgi:cell division septation protein DedD